MPSSRRLPLCTAIATLLALSACSDPRHGGDVPADEDQGHVNGLPVVTEVRLLPDVPRTEVQLWVEAEASDPDLQSVDLLCEWVVSGEVVADQWTCELGSNQFVKGDTVQAWVTPDDGLNLGEPVLSNEVLVANTPPEPSSVMFDPLMPAAGQSFDCSAEPAFDADDDPIVDYAFEWIVDGVAAGFVGELVPEGSTSIGETWTCCVTAHDGDDPSLPSCVSTVILDPDVVDMDGDGFIGEADCDPNDGDIHALAGDSYGDGVDSDCDGLDCEAAMGDMGYLAYCPDDVPSYQDGQDLCVAAGYSGYADILSASDNDFIVDLAIASNYPGSGDVWFGANDLAIEGTWVTATGVPLGYTNWNVEEPNNAGSSGNEDCGLIYTSAAVLGNWNDVECWAASLGVLCGLR